MGLKDFAKGIGHAVASVGKDLGESGVNLGNMVGYTLDPTHWDDIGKGAVKGTEFIANHPGESAHIAGIVGKQMLKDSFTTPTGLLTTGLTVASGGLGVASKLGLIAESAGAVAKGAEAIEGIEAGASAVKGARAATAAAEGLEAGTTAANTSRLGRVGEFLTGGQKAQVGQGEVTAFDKVLGAGYKNVEGGGVERTLGQRIREPLNVGSRLRTGAAEKILAGAGEEGASVGRQALAAMVQGSTGGTMPTRLEGMSDAMYNAQKNVWRASKATSRATAVTGAETSAKKAAQVAEITANPRKAAFDLGTKNAGKISELSQFAEEPGGQQRMELGDLKPLTQPSGDTSVSQPGYTQMELPLSYPVPARSPNYGGQAEGTAKAPVAVSGKRLNSFQRAYGPNSGYQRKQVHAWQGAGREVFGGISTNYDWRTAPLANARPLPGSHSYARMGQRLSGDDDTEDQPSYVSQGQMPKKGGIAGKLENAMPGIEILPPESGSYTKDAVNAARSYFQNRAQGSTRKEAFNTAITPSQTDYDDDLPGNKPAPKFKPLVQPMAF